MFESLRAAGFQVEFHSHAEAILSVDFADVAAQLEEILLNATIPIEEIVGSGGGETKGTQRLRRALHEQGWRKHKFEIQRTIDGVARELISHEVDHIARFPAGTVALEIEWNNKDPFFDRDLENYKRLHADGAISLGILITRGISLQDNMRSMVIRFAEENGINEEADLRRIGLNPDAPTARRLRTTPSGRNVLWACLGGVIRPGQIRSRYYALAQTRGSSSSRRRKPVPAVVDRLAR